LIDSTSALIDRLDRFQGLVSCTHTTSILRSANTSTSSPALLYPIRQRVVFKIAGLVHQSLVGLAPAYLADNCRLLSDIGRRPLRSNSYDMRKLLAHNKIGGRSFSATGPRLWNDLLPGLFQTIFENSFIWRPKHLVTLLNL